MTILDYFQTITFVQAQDAGILIPNIVCYYDKTTIRAAV